MLKKVKKWFGIEGLKIGVQLEEFYYREDRDISGLIVLQAKDAETVESISIKLIEKYARGRGKNKLIDEYIMSHEIMSEIHEIEPETNLEVPFTILYDEKVSKMDELERSNFFLSGVVKTAKFFKKAKSTYRIEIEANVKGTKFSPFVSQEIILK
jgi:hypothetical protein